MLEKSEIISFLLGVSSPLGQGTYFAVIHFSDPGTEGEPEDLGLPSCILEALHRIPEAQGYGKTA